PDYSNQTERRFAFRRCRQGVQPKPQKVRPVYRAATGVAENGAGLERVPRFAEFPRNERAASGEKNSVAPVVHCCNVAGGYLNGAAVAVAEIDCAGSGSPKTLGQHGRGA